MKQKNTVKIIGGQYRGRVLRFPDIAGLRPTPNRVRETVFNWLMMSIRGARCLDAFAGGGALGFEAASRGASEVTLIEKHAKAVKTLTDNKNIIQMDAVHVIQQDALKFFNQKPKQVYDVIFLDPPFNQGFLEKCLSLVLEHGWLAKNGLIYFEAERALSLDLVLDKWAIEKHKIAGEVQFGLLILK